MTCHNPLKRSPQPCYPPNVLKTLSRLWHHKSQHYHIEISMKPLTWNTQPHRPQFSDNLPLWIYPSPAEKRPSESQPLLSTFSCAQCRIYTGWWCLLSLGPCVASSVSAPGPHVFQQRLFGTAWQEPVQLYHRSLCAYSFSISCTIISTIFTNLQTCLDLLYLLQACAAPCKLPRLCSRFSCFSFISCRR